MSSAVVAEGEEKPGRIVGTRAAFGTFVDVVPKMELLALVAGLDEGAIKCLQSKIELRTT